VTTVIQLCSKDSAVQDAFFISFGHGVLQKDLKNLTDNSKDYCKSPDEITGAELWEN